MASARAQSRAARAARRAAIACSMAPVSPGAVEPRRRIGLAAGRAARRRRAARSPPRASPASAASARPCKCEIASGVFRSSHSAAMTFSGTLSGTARVAGRWRRLQRAVETIELAAALLQQRVGEFQRLAVMRSQQQQQAGHLGGHTLQHVAQRGEIAEALGHLDAVDTQHAVMQPVAGEAAAGEGAQALCALVLVVREHEVVAAGHGCRSSGRGSARTSHCTRYASPAARGPKGCPSPAAPVARASTARSRRDHACTAPPQTRAPASRSSGLRPDRLP